MTCVKVRLWHHLPYNIPGRGGKGPIKGGGSPPPIKRRPPPIKAGGGGTMTPEGFGPKPPLARNGPAKDNARRGYPVMKFPI